MITKKWQPYPTYKDSGVEWLGEIPEHWEVKRLKFNAPYSNTRFSNKPDNLTYIGLENIESGTGRLLINEPIENVDSTVSYFNKGDILFGKLRPYLAKVIIAPFNGVSTSELICFQPTDSYNNLYFFYLLLSSNFIHSVNALTYGTKMPRVNPDQIANFLLSVPPLPEQQKIAEFLDEETSKIDKLITKKERLIELLKEKRTALISHAVTKGLNPDVPMKDSGVEWLGEIPEHWEVKKLKNAAFLNLDTLNEDIQPDYLLNYIDIGNVTSDGSILETQEFQFKQAPSRARRKVKNGDTIISTVRTYLRAISLIKDPPENLIVSTGFAVLSPRVEIDSRFLFRFVQSSEFVEKVVAHSEGVGYPAINPSKLACLPIWLPLLHEQQKIAQFLDRETSKIDKLITKTRTSIDHLKEYRTALISAAVTGKIDVREH
jgi:type I restriction enzyme S subunit